MNPVVTDIIGEVIQKVSAKVFTDPAYAAVKTATEQQLVHRLRKSLTCMDIPLKSSAHCRKEMVQITN